ncbi:hypothetical protein MAR_016193 [Mya arenaria]|uniref:Uncharacterized protein n=1 Tax=Mya arenaria TaxID=6604 RepID=A0ABY7FMX9_MYAAR|nr:hypothetical protein MAR_016193 [Mya arenaria]
MCSDGWTHTSEKGVCDIDIDECKQSDKGLCNNTDDACVRTGGHTRLRKVCVSLTLMNVNNLMYVAIKDSVKTRKATDNFAGQNNGKGN